MFYEQFLERYTWLLGTSAWWYQSLHARLVEHTLFAHNVLIVLSFFLYSLFHLVRRTTAHLLESIHSDAIPFKKKKKWCAQCAPHLVRLFANGIFESDWRQTICAHLTVSPSNATTFDNFRTHRLTVKVIIMRISLASSEYYPCIGIGIDWHRKNWLHLDTAERHVGEIETSKLYGCLWEWIRLCNWNVLSMRDISFNGNWLCAGW